jgi:DNA-binding CsgD family transcriptional regulator
MFGYEPGELLGKQVIPFVVAPESETCVKEQMRTGFTTPYEAVGLRKDGTTFPMEVWGRNLKYQGRDVRAGVIRDITERKKAEEGLRQARDQLEERVKERTAKLREINRLCSEEITERRRTEKTLRESEEALKRQAAELEEVNSALKVLLKRRADDKSEFEEKVLLNVKEFIMPYVNKLSATPLNHKQATYLSILQSNIDEIVSPFAQRLSSRFISLTPAEIQIAQLIKDGRTTKEMAELLNLSTRTIESHRRKIRSKMGIKNRRVNLRAALSTQW